MEKAIIIDIDGVILDTSRILHEINELKLRGDDLWDYFYAHCNNGRKSPFMENIIPFVNCLKDSVKIFLSTARNERIREGTEERLKFENFPYTKLYMRQAEDFRPSPEVKADHLRLIQQEYEVVAFIDDDLTNCQMARDNGILALRKV